jgi:4-hydroxybenzoate polyprenyltransferase
MDLDIDRRRPQRANDPLVTGRVTRAAALGVAGAQIPFAFLATRWLGASSAAVLALGVAFTALGVYDVGGKRCFLPPLMDFVQAIGWACLLLFGAFTAGGLTDEAVWLCVAVIAYAMLINGVHGALRDLRSDLEGGARTTATYFGARLLSQDSVALPRSLLVYGIALHSVIFVAVGGALGLPRAEDPRWWFASSLLALAVLLCAGLLLAAYRSASDARRAETAGTAHLFVCMSTLAIPAVADARGSSLAAVAVVFALPLLARAAYRKAKSE